MLSIRSPTIAIDSTSAAWPRSAMISPSSVQAAMCGASAASGSPFGPASGGLVAGCCSAHEARAMAASTPTNRLIVSPPFATGYALAHQSAVIAVTVTRWTIPARRKMMSAVVARDRHVIIVGAGIGGLTLALALDEAGISAEVFESAAEI